MDKSSSCFKVGLSCLAIQRLILGNFFSTFSNGIPALVIPHSKIAGLIETFGVFNLTYPFLNKHYLHKFSYNHTNVFCQIQFQHFYYKIPNILVYKCFFSLYALVLFLLYTDPFLCWNGICKATRYLIPCLFLAKLKLGLELKQNFISMGDAGN